MGVINKSNVPDGAYQNAPYKIWIRHWDNSINRENIVYPFHNEKQRRYQFRNAKKLLLNYKGKTIVEARFYDTTPSRSELGRWVKVGDSMVFTGGCEFMNTL